MQGRLSTTSKKLDAIGFNEFLVANCLLDANPPPITTGELPKWWDRVFQQNKATWGTNANAYMCVLGEFDYDNALFQLNNQISLSTQVLFWLFDAQARPLGKPFVICPCGMWRPLEPTFSWGKYILC